MVSVKGGNVATTEDIERLIGELRGQIKVLKQTLEPDSDPAKTVSNVETQLGELEKRYTEIKRNTGDLAPIETELRNLDKLLELTARGQAQTQGTEKSRFERTVGFLGQNASGLGAIALGVAFLFTIIAIAVALGTMGASSWQTLPGGRAVLLLALTFAFVTFGGALLVAPLFSESVREV